MAEAHSPSLKQVKKSSTVDVSDSSENEDEHFSDASEGRNSKTPPFLASGNEVLEEDPQPIATTSTIPSSNNTEYLPTTRHDDDLQLSKLSTHIKDSERVPVDSVSPVQLISEETLSAETVKNYQIPEVSEEAGLALADDFDDFEDIEGDAEFGEFDDGFDTSLVTPEEVPAASTQVEVVPTVQKPFVSCYRKLQPQIAATSEGDLLTYVVKKIYNFSGFQGLEEVIESADLHLKALLPKSSGEPIPSGFSSSDGHLDLLTDRRHFISMVTTFSLGVPVDLDEILPASKQKKLVLPSITSISTTGQSPRTSTDSLAAGSGGRIDKIAGSATNANSQSASAPSKKSRGPRPPPELDISTTKILCSITNAALSNFTDDELREHLARLEQLNTVASECLEYWLKMKEGALGDKETFEGVIENLVKHARKVRK
ncbi:MAG: hypothetical protein M1829_002775 [Trizodia sp. TS-e1964]|nr:MAG: hypothetical protein M1829_002775 [Trizodia sp. TS-e1964]